MGVGSGPPVDDIDRSCREFATCYSCLYNTKIGGACDEENVTRYVIKGQIAEGGRKYLVCGEYILNRLNFYVLFVRISLSLNIVRFNRV